jgi:hypothetical protein
MRRLSSLAVPLTLPVAGGSEAFLTWVRENAPVEIADDRTEF